MNEALAKHYGIAGVTGSGFVSIDSQLPERAGGILTQPAIMAATDQHPDRGDVIHRGLFIYRSLFVCGSAIGMPPANATAVNAGLPMNATERDRANFRATAPQGCGACHTSFDPFGLATEKLPIPSAATRRRTRAAPRSIAAPRFPIAWVRHSPVRSRAYRT